MVPHTYFHPALPAIIIYMMMVSRSRSRLPTMDTTPFQWRSPPCLPAAPSPCPARSPAPRLVRLVEQRGVDGEVHLRAHQRGHAPGALHVLPPQLGAQPRRQALLDHRHRHVARHLADAPQPRERAPLRDLLRGHGRRAGLGRPVQHLVRDDLHAGDGGRQAHPGEDVHVVALGGDQGEALPPPLFLAVEGHGPKGATCGHHRPAARAPVGLLRGALRLARRVGHGHDDWPLIDAPHARQHRLAERAGHRRQAQEHVRPEPLHQLFQGRAVADLRVHPGRFERPQAPVVVGVAAGAVGAPQRPLARHHHKARAGLGLAEALLHHAQHDLLAHPQPGAARARAHHPGVAQRGARRPAGAEQARHRDGARALDVVVEHAVALAVARQQRHGLGRLEVLELHDAVGVPGVDRPHELVDHVVVCGALKPLAPVAKVVPVPAQGRVVRAHIQHDGQHPVGRDPAGGAVQRELADGDAHPVRAQVPEPEDARAVRDDDDVDLVARPVVHHRRHVAAIVPREVHPARPAVLVAELLAHHAHGWGVDQRSHLFDVIYKCAVVQGFVPVCQVLQVHVLVHIGGLLIHMIHYNGDLLFNSPYDGGKEASKA
mmetsp:Transcript_41365/g.60957  ORF Transcript_41365/g.60957 Transcript_41365/m.60957 type:complete len:601 (-) Transcript_41365:322-2124(-)